MFDGDDQEMKAMQQYAWVPAPPTGQPMSWGRRVTVVEWERGLLFRHGRLVDELAPGPHRRWGRGYSVRRVDQRPRILAVPTQEVPTRDGVSVKVTVAGRVRVSDAKTYVTATSDADEELYLAIQIALRELVATSTVEELLTERASTGDRLLAGLRGTDDLGLTVEQLEVKDVILPAELKRAQADLLVARAKAVADLERARAETASLRSLANAARLAAENPALLQLRMLQSVEAADGATVVLGGPPAPVAPAPRRATRVTKKRT